MLLGNGCLPWPIQGTYNTDTHCHTDILERRQTHKAGTKLHRLQCRNPKHTHGDTDIWNAQKQCSHSTCMDIQVASSTHNS